MEEYTPLALIIGVKYYYYYQNHYGGVVVVVAGIVRKIRPRPPHYTLFANRPNI